MRIFLIALTALFLNNCDQPINKSPNETSTSNTLQNNTPTDTEKVVVLTEKDYISYFQKQWDSIKPAEKGKIPKYSDYVDNLQKVLTDMNTMVQSDPSAFKQLNSLRLKFIRSYKNTDALKKYATYGQIDDLDLGTTIKEYYKMRDVIDLPDGVDIVNYKITGQSDKGWLVLVRFIPTGKEHFYEETLDVRYSAADKMFYVENHVFNNRLYN